MADNAIEKLFEEMRAAKVACEDATSRKDEAAEAYNNADHEIRAARNRINLLQRTLEKHIHEGIPIVQAKMQAHEEEAEAVSARITSNTISATAISAGRITSNVVGTSFQPKLPWSGF